MLHVRNGDVVIPAIAAARREEPPWISDQPLWALADDLDPLVRRDGDGYILAPEGRAVLAGEARRETPERWLGGVQLGAGGPRWAWDAGDGEVVRVT